MKNQKWLFYLLALAMLPLIVVLPLSAEGDNDYNISDIALTPGSKTTQLNVTWHTTSDVEIEGNTCQMKIAKRPFNFKGAKRLFPFFPPGSKTFEGEWASAGIDEYGNDDYYCEVTVKGLGKSGDYAYKLTDGQGNWSDSFDYTARDHKKFGFLYVADSQIGASGPKDLSRSRDVQPVIEDWYDPDVGGNTVPDIDYDTTMKEYLKNYTDLAEDYLKDKYADDDTVDIDALLDAYIAGTLEDISLEAEIDAYLLSEYNADPDSYKVSYIYDPVFYDEFSAEGRYTDLADLAALDSDLADEILALIEARIAEQMEASANDTEGNEEEGIVGWTTTVELMTDMFPRASFIVSGGDQVELMDAEWEYTGFFTPYELTSIPVAPTYASHDRAVNFEYHFNLPNESEEYGQDSNGVGDYYFTYGNTLIMVLNMDVTNSLFPAGAPPPPPPGGGGPGGSSDETDTDGDGIIDDDDLCPDTYGESIHGCPLTNDYDDDEDGVGNLDDGCNNTFVAHLEAGLISNITGCPYFDDDNDGVPNEDNEGNAIDRCNNTDNDFTVDEDGCADCAYIETDDELRAWLEGLENTCKTTIDEDTGEEITTCELDKFKASLEEHRAFIAEAIAANPQAKWKIVVWHYSIYSAAMHSTDDQSEGIRYLFTPMLEELDIDVVLMGHDHAYTKTYQMLGNEPQLDQISDCMDRIINPTGILYLTASSSSGSKYYGLNCNIGDETSDSAVYYEYADVYYENIPTFTYFEIDDNTLKFKSFSYTLDEDTGYYEPILIDKYAMEKKPPRKKPYWKNKWWQWWR